MKEKKIDKFWLYMIAVIIGMIFANQAIKLYDRFSGNESAWNFYTPTSNMTCVVVKSRGEQVMFCAAGDRRVKEEK